MEKVITIRIEAEQIAEAINNLANALTSTKCQCKEKPAEVNKSVTSISNDEVANWSPQETLKNEDFEMFQEVADLAKELKKLDEEAYNEILYKYVAQGKQYSAIEARDWGNAIKDFKEAIKGLKKKPVKKVEEPKEDDYEDDLDEVEKKPKYKISEIRSMAALAKTKGVKVGVIMRKVANVTKVSALPESKYDEFAEALKEAEKELEDE